MFLFFLADLSHNSTILCDQTQEKTVDRKFLGVNFGRKLPKKKKKKTSLCDPGFACNIVLMSKTWL